MAPQIIRIPISRRHYPTRATGEVEVSAMDYNRQWVFAEDDRYLCILRDNELWDHISQNAVLRPESLAAGGVPHETIVCGVNDQVGINVTPKTTWAAQYYALEFERGAGPYESSLVGANGSMFLNQNLIYDATNTRWQFGAAQSANMIRLTGFGVEIYAFGTGVADAEADLTSGNTNAFEVSSALGTVVNFNSGDFDFTVNHDTGNSFFAGGAPAQGARVAVGTITPLENIGTAAGDYAADDNGLHVMGPTGFMSHLVVEGGGCTIDMCARGSAANDKIAQLRNDAAGVLEFRSLNDDLTERIGDILNLDLGSGFVGVGVAPTTAALEIASTTGALRVPRMTTGEKNALTAVSGDIVYDSTLNKFQGYENGAWASFI